jgi:hypothetical protein
VKLLCSAALGLLLQAAVAVAAEPVVYRAPDGSIGFAEDRWGLPPGAVIVPRRSVQDRVSAGPQIAASGAADEERERAQRAALRARVAAGRAQQARAEARTSAVAERYQRERGELRAQVREQREQAERTSCRTVERWFPAHERGRARHRQSRHPHPRRQLRSWLDCSERDAALRAAQLAEERLTARLREVEDRCMDDPECAPGELR